MRIFTIFGESFLDGFTMSGFLTRLRHPDQPARMFSSATSDVDPGWQAISFQPKIADPASVMVSGSLRNIPPTTLHTMIGLLQKEEADRQSSHKASGGAIHGVSR